MIYSKVNGNQIWLERVDQVKSLRNPVIRG